MLVLFFRAQYLSFTSISITGVKFVGAGVYVCVSAHTQCVCECARVCVCASVCVCMHACVYVHVYSMDMFWGTSSNLFLVIIFEFVYNYVVP